MIRIAASKKVEDALVTTSLNTQTDVTKGGANIIIEWQKNAMQGTLLDDNLRNPVDEIKWAQNCV